MHTKAAKLFQSGGSQAVRLPAEFRFEGDVVYVRRDGRTGDVILSATPPHPWADFVSARARLGPAPDDFLAERDQGDADRDPFAEG